MNIGSSKSRREPRKQCQGMREQFAILVNTCTNIHARSYVGTRPREAVSLTKRRCFRDWCNESVSQPRIVYIFVTRLMYSWFACARSHKALPTARS